MKTKTCTACSKPKSIRSFPWKNKAKGKRAPICKLCMAEQTNAWYYANKSHHKANVLRRQIEIRADLNSKRASYFSEHPCVDCRETDPIVLDFDHEDPAQKSGNVSEMIHSCFPWNVVLQEIEKCKVRCANCHRRRTHQQRMDEVAGIQPASSA